MHELDGGAPSALEYEARPPLACSYYTYWSGVGGGGLEYFSPDGRALGCMTAWVSLSLVMG